MSRGSVLLGRSRMALSIVIPPSARPAVRRGIASPPPYLARGLELDFEDPPRRAVDLRPPVGERDGRRVPGQALDDPPLRRGGAALDARDDGVLLRLVSGGQELPREVELPDPEEAVEDLVLRRADPDVLRARDLRLLVRDALVGIAAELGVPSIPLVADPADVPERDLVDLRGAPDDVVAAHHPVEEPGQPERGVADLGVLDDEAAPEPRELALLLDDPVRAEEGEHVVVARVERGEVGGLVRERSSERGGELRVGPRRGPAAVLELGHPAGDLPVPG